MVHIIMIILNIPVVYGIFLVLMFVKS